MRKLFNTAADIYSTLRSHAENKDYLKFKNVYFNNYAFGIALISVLGSIVWILKDIFLIHVGNVLLDVYIRVTPAFILPFFKIMKRPDNKWLLALVTTLVGIVATTVWSATLGFNSPEGLTGEGWITYYVILFGISLMATYQAIMYVSYIVYTLLILITASDFGGPIVYNIPITRIVSTAVIMCLGLCTVSIFIRVIFTKLYDKEIDIKNSSRKIKELSMRDALSGLYNRYILSDIAPDDKLAYNAIIMMLDVDRFKSINDTYHHSGGDEAIIFASQALKSLCEPDDVLVRYGGDEFLIIFHRMDLNVEKFFYRLADILDSPLNKYHVTFSIGVAQYLEGSDFYSSIKQADSAAFISKEMGRNRYTIFNETIEVLDVNNI